MKMGGPLNWCENFGLDGDILLKLILKKGRRRVSKVTQKTEMLVVYLIY